MLKLRKLREMKVSKPISCEWSEKLQRQSQKPRKHLRGFDALLVN